STCSSWVTSAATAIARTPSFSISSTRSATVSGLRTRTATSLPASASATARARPIPRAAPVTTETLPDSENASNTDLINFLLFDSQVSGSGGMGPDVFGDSVRIQLVDPDQPVGRAASFRQVGQPDDQEAHQGTGRRQHRADGAPPDRRQSDHGQHRSRER